MLYYEKTLKPLSRHLRENMTNAERLLWSRLRRRQIHGMQFCRQKPLANFICVFHGKLDTHSRASWTPIPGEAGQ